MTQAQPEEAEVVFSSREEGIRLDLMDRGRSLSHLAVDAQMVRYGSTSPGRGAAATALTCTGPFSGMGLTGLKL